MSQLIGNTPHTKKWWVIPGTLAIAFCFWALPAGPGWQNYAPDWVSLILIYWCFAIPGKVSLGSRLILMTLPTDPSQGIPVQLLRKGLGTIVYGSGQGDLLRAPYLGRTADVRKDDIFITSGLAGRFPAGYPVGRVIKIKRDPNAPFLDVLAQPSASLGSAREVLLIWRGTDNGHVSDRVTSESIDR